MKLEVGKRYKNRDGNITRIIVFNENLPLPFGDEFGNTYTSCGKYYSVDEFSYNDLIEEVSTIVPNISNRDVTLQEQLDLVLQLEKQLQEAKKQLKEML